MNGSRTPHRSPCVARRIGDRALVLVPGTTEVRLLGPTATIVWDALATSEDSNAVHDVVRRTYPQIAEAERRVAVEDILRSLESDGLVTYR